MISLFVSLITMTLSLTISLMMMAVRLTISLTMIAANLFASLLSRGAAPRRVVVGSPPQRRGALNPAGNSNDATKAGVAVVLVIVALVVDPRLGIALAMLATVAAIAWWVMRSRSTRHQTPSAGELVRGPQGNDQTKEDLGELAPDGQNPNVTATIDGRAVSISEAYDTMLNYYEQHLDIREQLYAARRERAHAYQTSSSFRKQWSDTLAESTEEINGFLAKLDVLEAHHPELATQERGARRAKLASRQLDMDSSPEPDAGETRASTTGAAAMDVPDQIRRLAELRDEGILTEEEFQSKKRDLLDRL